MQTRPIPRRERGAALLIILTIIGIGAAFLLVSALNKANQQIERDKLTSAALAQAKEALIGFAITYADTHPSDVNGFLLCPDRDNNPLTPGQADPPCGATNVSVIGRLPWNTLGLPALRDSRRECLWYAISGFAKDNPKTGFFFNWDTTGQFIVEDAAGNILAGAVPHDRPLAVILAPRSPINGQTHAGAASECGGNTTTANYLDGADPIYAGTAPGAGATSTLTVATATSIANGTNNDQGLWITSKDIFDRIKKRSDFAAFVSNELLNITKNNLSSLLPAPGTIDFTNPTPVETSGGAIVGSLEIGRVPKTALTSTPLKRWQDNLLYARCTSGGSCLTVNGSSCTGVVIFAGERTATQSRATNAQKNTWSNYLESSVLAAFNAGATVFSGASAYSPASPSADVLACITAPPPGTQVSFAANFGSFVPVGSSVTVDPVNQTVIITTSGGSGGCFWFPTAIPVSGKTLRAHYDFTFSSNDPIGGPDYGNGFTFSLLRSDAGAPVSCGTQANMGAFASSDLLGFISLLVENDVHQDIANNDPAGNHTAIMYSGNTAHSAVAGGNGYTTSACNGTAQGCLFSPADKYEESPTPLSHGQRIEIHTGYSDATCTSAGGSFAQIKIWVDCATCNDTSADFLATPSASRCIALPAEMNSVYFGFTGGFANPQGVTIWNFDLRTQ